MVTNQIEVNELVQRGAIFYVSHSGGKDSQAMYLSVSKIVPKEQIVVVHADLGEVEWTGTQTHIKETIDHHLNVVWAIKKDGTRNYLLDMVLDRHEKRPDSPAWPSSSQRYCTSGLKRGPLEKFIRHDLKKRGKTLAVNCMGLRAQESPSRAKKDTLTLNERLSLAGREIYDWLPIHTLTTDEVFQLIADNDQAPHWAYQQGNERLSCVFCIFGSANDLKNGAKHRPELAEKYITLEQLLGKSMFYKSTLAEKLKA